MHADAIEAEDLGPDSRQLPLALGPRLFESVPERRPGPQTAGRDAGHERRQGAQVGGRVDEPIDACADRGRRRGHGSTLVVQRFPLGPFPRLVADVGRGLRLDPEELNAVRAGDRRTIDLQQEVARRLVPRRRGERELEPAQPAREGLLTEARRHPVLDPPPERAAAQQEALDAQSVSDLPEERRPYEPVVAESVAHLDGEAAGLAVVQEPRDLLRPAADGRGVELVRPLGELGDAGHVARLGSEEADLQVQVLDELLEAQGLLAHALARGFQPVELGTASVLRGRGSDAIERPHVLQERRYLRCVGGQGQGEDLGIPPPHFRRLQRVVVEEDEAVEPDVQLLRQLPQTLGLRRPVDPPGRQVLALEHHVGMAVEDLEHVAFAVLAGQAKGDPGGPLREGELLEAAPRRVHRDAERAVLTAHSAPKGLVAVHDQHLVRRALQRVHCPRDRRAQGGVDRRSVRDVPMPRERRRPLALEGRSGAQLGRTDEMDALEAPNGGGEATLLPLDRVGVPASSPLRFGAEAEDQRRGGACLERLDRSYQVFGRLVRVGQGSQVFEADGHHVDTAVVGGEQAPGVEQLLEDLAVRGELDLEREPEPPHPEQQRVLDRFGRERRRDRDPARTRGHPHGGRHRRAINPSRRSIPLPGAATPSAESNINGESILASWPNVVRLM